MKRAKASLLKGQGPKVQSVSKTASDKNRATYFNQSAQTPRFLNQSRVNRVNPNASDSGARIFPRLTRCVFMRHSNLISLFNLLVVSLVFNLELFKVY